MRALLGALIGAGIVALFALALARAARDDK